MSNFLIWQAAYAELYFTPIFWPDFGPDDLHAAVLDYSRRERRFGRVSACAQAIAADARPRDQLDRCRRCRADPGVLRRSRLCRGLRHPDGYRVR